MSISWFSSDSKTKNCIATIYDSNRSYKVHSTGVVDNYYSHVESVCVRPVINLLKSAI